MTMATGSDFVCQGTKKDGSPCSQKAKSGSDYCRHHISQDPKRVQKKEEKKNGVKDDPVRKEHRCSFVGDPKDPTTACTIAGAPTSMIEVEGEQVPLLWAAKKAVGGDHSTKVLCHEHMEAANKVAQVETGKGGAHFFPLKESIERDRRHDEEVVCDDGTRLRFGEAKCFNMRPLLELQRQLELMGKDARGDRLNARLALLAGPLPERAAAKVGGKPFLIRLNEDGPWPLSDKERAFYQKALGYEGDRLFLDLWWATAKWEESHAPTKPAKEPEPEPDALEDLFGGSFEGVEAAEDRLEQARDRIKARKDRAEAVRGWINQLMDGELTGDEVRFIRLEALEGRIHCSNPECSTEAYIGEKNSQGWEELGILKPFAGFNEEQNYPDGTPVRRYHWGVAVKAGERAKSQGRDSEIRIVVLCQRCRKVAMAASFNRALDQALAGGFHGQEAKDAANLRKAQVQPLARAVERRVDYLSRSRQERERAPRRGRSLRGRSNTAFESASVDEAREWMSKQGNGGALRVSAKERRRSSNGD